MQASKFGIQLLILVSALPAVCTAQQQNEPPATPRNDAVVSVQELQMAGKADSLFAKGVQRLLKGDAQGSLGYFQQTLAKDPGYYRAYHDLGLAHYQLGETMRAEEDFQKSIDLR